MARSCSVHAVCMGFILLAVLIGGAHGQLSVSGVAESVGCGSNYTLTATCNQTPVAPITCSFGGVAGTPRLVSPLVLECAFDDAALGAQTSATFIISTGVNPVTMTRSRTPYITSMGAVSSGGIYTYVRGCGFGAGAATPSVTIDGAATTVVAQTANQFKFVLSAVLPAKTGAVVAGTQGVLTIGCAAGVCVQDVHPVITSVAGTNIHCNMFTASTFYTIGGDGFSPNIFGNNAVYLSGVLFTINSASTATSLKVSTTSVIPSGGNLAFTVVSNGVSSLTQTGVATIAVAPYLAGPAGPRSYDAFGAATFNMTACGVNTTDLTSNLVSLTATPAPTCSALAYAGGKLLITCSAVAAGAYDMALATSVAASPCSACATVDIGATLIYDIPPDGTCLTIEGYGFATSGVAPNNLTLQQADGSLVSYLGAAYSGGLMVITGLITIGNYSIVSLSSNGIPVPLTAAVAAYRVLIAPSALNVRPSTTPTVNSAVLFSICTSGFILQYPSVSLVNITMGGQPCGSPITSTNYYVCNFMFSVAGVYSTLLVANGLSMVSSDLASFQPVFTGAQLLSTACEAPIAVEIDADGWSPTLANNVVELDGAPCSSPSLVGSLLTCTVAANSLSNCPRITRLSVNGVLPTFISWTGYVRTRITSVAPTSGPSSGGTLVTLSGCGFGSAGVLAERGADQMCWVTSYHNAPYTTTHVRTTEIISAGFPLGMYHVNASIAGVYAVCTAGGLGCVFTYTAPIMYSLTRAVVRAPCQGAFDSVTCQQPHIDSYAMGFSPHGPSDQCLNNTVTLFAPDGHAEECMPDCDDWSFVWAQHFLKAAGNYTLVAGSGGINFTAAAPTRIYVRPYVDLSPAAVLQGVYTLTLTGFGFSVISTPIVMVAGAPCPALPGWDANNIQCLIPLLLPGEYPVDVTINGATGRAVQNVTLVANVPVTPALSFNARAHALFVSWNVPFSYGCPVLGYTLTFCCDPGMTVGCNTTWVTATNFSLTEYDGQPLPSNQTFYFKISALSSLGPSADSSVYQAASRPETPDQPLPPTLVVTPGSRGINVSWVPPEDYGHPITGYYITVAFNGTSITSLASACPPWVVLAIAASGDYTVSVVAVNAVGASLAGTSHITVNPPACPALPAPLQGTPCPSADVGETCTIDCGVYFSPVNGTLTCTATGWQGGPSACFPLCSIFPAPPGGTPACAQAAGGESCLQTCQQTQATMVRTCVASATEAHWDTTVALDCTPPAVVPNGGTTSSQESASNSKITPAATAGIAIGILILLILIVLAMIYLVIFRRRKAVKYQRKIQPEESTPEPDLKKVEMFATPAVTPANSPASTAAPAPISAPNNTPVTTTATTTTTSSSTNTPPAPHPAPTVPVLAASGASAASLNTSAASNATGDGGGSLQPMTPKPLAPLSLTHNSLLLTRDNSTASLVRSEQALVSSTASAGGISAVVLSKSTSSANMLGPSPRRPQSNGATTPTSPEDTASGAAAVYDLEVVVRQLTGAAEAIAAAREAVHAAHRELTALPTAMDLDALRSGDALSGTRRLLAAYDAAVVELERCKTEGRTLMSTVEPAQGRVMREANTRVGSKASRALGQSDDASELLRVRLVEEPSISEAGRAYLLRVRQLVMR